MRISANHAVMAPGHKGSIWWRLLDAAWRLVSPLFRRSRRLRAFFYGLPRSRLRTALVVRYYRDIMADLDAGNITRQLPAIATDAEVRLFEMEDFRRPEGAEQALRQWREIFPGLKLEMSEFINPDGTDVLCIGRAAGGGASSGAAVNLEIALAIKVIDGMAVELSMTRSKPEALKAVGLRE